LEKDPKPGQHFDCRLMKLLAEDAGKVHLDSEPREPVR
jgi:hypothetical protein